MAINPDALDRCPWARSDLDIAYHDAEWGVPVHDDTTMFEFLVLEGAQAGLSWSTILRKRDAYRSAYRGFAPEVVAQFGEKDIQRLLKNDGIVRNRLKVRSSIENARHFCEVQSEYGSFWRYAWEFVGGAARQNAFESMSKVPAKTIESERMSKDLRKRGFRFVGPTICYAFMQATGMVNDHLVDCFRREQIAALAT
ncbi:MAG: DNA-3-methyladenine glycosylase I [Rhodothermia bacterium]|nr:DNA-3-methyladenine glycosylase I [Rhodothermia bacterium]